MSNIAGASLAAAFLLHLAYASRPNIVLFLTDDQDVLLDSMDFMPNLRSLVQKQGVTFPWSFSAVPVCCPSRASLHTGMYQQNTGVVNNSINGNCASTQWSQGPELKNMASYLSTAGYKTYFGGKYLNNYGLEAEPLSYVPPGWTDWQGLQGNSVYYNYKLSNNGVTESHGHVYAEDYLTDLITNRSLTFIDTHAAPDQPLFIVISTPASHQPADPAPQYSTMFPDVVAPRQPNFNVRIPDTHWFEASQGVSGPMDANAIAFVDLLYRRRLQTLQSVDEAISRVINKLASHGLMNNTYMFYTADNGYHLGQAGLALDKRQPWHYDTRVPLIIRGPGIAPNTTNLLPVTNVDLAPTFLDLAGVTIPEQMDGLSLRDVLMANDSNEASLSRQSVLVSYHGEGQPPPAACQGTTTDPSMQCYEQVNVTTPPFWYGENFCNCQDSANNTYACIFTVNSTHNFRYCEFETSMVEYFDILHDPYEMTNAAKSLSPAQTTTLHNNLNALKTCHGSDECSQF